MGIENKVEPIEKKQTLLLKNREKLTLDGVKEVLRFDEGAVVLKTLLGVLTVEGVGLHLTKLLLDCGEVSIEGKIMGLFYEEKTARKSGLLGFFGRGA